MLYWFAFCSPEQWELEPRRYKYNYLTCDTEECAKEAASKLDTLKIKYVILEVEDV